MNELLYAQSEGLLAAGIFVVLLVAAETGYRRGLRWRTSHGEGASQVSNLQTATMGLLALLLAFTFAMAESRFEVRRELVIDESNAIGTVWLRSQMLPDPIKEQTAHSLRGYLDARLEYAHAGIDSAKIEAARRKADAFADQLWAETTQAVSKNPAPVPTGLFVSAVNEMFDVREKRDSARENHVPEVVLWLLFLVSLGSMELVGYGCGVGGNRNFVRTTIVSGLISLVILVIIDLDRPRRGIIEISRASMVALREQMNAPRPSQ